MKKKNFTVRAGGHTIEIQGDITTDHNSKTVLKKEGDKEYFESLGIKVKN